MEWHVAQGLSNAAGIGRRNAYATYGTPVAWFDGSQTISAGGNSAGATAGLVASYGGVIDAHRAAGSPLVVEAVTSWAPPNLQVTIDVSLRKGETFDPAGHVVRAILYEEDVSYCCDTNGSDHFPHVGRAITAGEALDLSAGPVRAVQSFPLDEAWNVAKLRVVALVQEGETGPIVQADAAAGDTSAVEPRTWASVKADFR